MGSWLLDLSPTFSWWFLTQDQCEQNGWLAGAVVALAKARRCWHSLTEVPASFHAGSEPMGSLAGRDGPGALFAPCWAPRLVLHASASVCQGAR